MGPLLLLAPVTSWRAQTTSRSPWHAAVAANGIEALAGADYLAFIQEAHDAFRDALGVGDTLRESIDSAGLQKTATELAHAIADYGRVLAGELDPKDDAR